MISSHHLSHAKNRKAYLGSIQLSSTSSYGVRALALPFSRGFSCPSTTHIEGILNFFTPCVVKNIKSFLIPCKKTLLIISRAFLYRKLPAHGHANSTFFITLSTLSSLRRHMVFNSNLFSQGLADISSHFRGDVQCIHGLVDIQP